MSDGYKKKYLKDVWEQFENNIRASAYTSRLTKFLENITRSMPITLEAQYSQDVLRIIQSGFDEDVLTWMRNETTYLVLMARMKNEERKAEFKARQEEDEAFRSLPNHPDKQSQQQQNQDLFQS